MSQLLLSLQAPNSILAVETSELSLMGYAPSCLLGTSFESLYGPLTDEASAGRAISDASLASVFSEMHITLYDAHGFPRKLKASFSPCSRLKDQRICCLVTLTEIQGPAFCDVPVTKNSSHLTSQQGQEHPAQDADSCESRRRQVMRNLIGAEANSETKFC